MIKVLTVLVVVLAVGYTFLWPTVHFILGMGASCAAKTTCSAVFVSNRNFSVNDLSLECSFGPLPYLVSVNIDYASKSVLATAIFGVDTQKAVFHDRHRGCGLLNAHELTHGHNIKLSTPRAETPADQEWPEGNKVLTPQNQKLSNVLGKHFEAPNERNTRAILVVRGGKVIYEQYAQPSFGPNTALLGWSMTKSITNALIGHRVLEGKMSLKDPISKFLHEFKNDNRSTILLEDVLHMASGLKWSEAYSPLKMLESDVIQMLYRYDAAAARPLEKSLGWTAGKEWCYSSGDTNLLQLALRRTFASDEEYWTYPARVLFDKLGASSAVMEVDRNGTFVGSSFSYLTARDWARFGLLYLRGGVWTNGERILPEGWTDFASAVFPESAGMYSGHFWKRSLYKLVPCHIDPAHVQGRINNELPLWPEDAYLASGYAGQMVIIVPSKDLVIVRLGYTPVGMDFSPYPLTLEVINALEQN